MRCARNTVAVSRQRHFKYIFGYWMFDNVKTLLLYIILSGVLDFGFVSGLIRNQFVRANRFALKKLCNNFLSFLNNNEAFWFHLFRYYIMSWVWPPHDDPKQDKRPPWAVTLLLLMLQRKNWTWFTPLWPYFSYPWYHVYWCTTSDPFKKIQL